MKKQNRRTFIRLFNASIVVLLVLVWNGLTIRHLNQVEKKKRILPFLKNKPVSFHDNYIVLNDKGKTSVYSSFCTHLRCKIHEVKNGRLICPCHGSEYDFDGNPVKGPAFKPLQKLRFKISSDQSSIQIEE